MGEKVGRTGRSSGRVICIQVIMYEKRIYVNKREKSLSHVFVY